jgi:hypothetical protein
MDKKLLFPPKLMQDELFKEFLETSFEFSEPVRETFKDVSEKYSGKSTLPQEAINEILRELGLESLSDLLSVSPVIDKQNVLGFANAIASLKGSETGYFLVLDLLNFSYTAVPWHEQSPRGEFNTFSLDVFLDASIIPEPYKTFQGIKRFTRDYLLPIISPLGYTYFVPINGPALSFKGAAHQIVAANIEQSVDPSLVYGNSGWIVADSLGQNWKIKVNGVGGLKAFRTADPNTPRAFYMSDEELKTYLVTVTPSGQIELVEELDLNPVLSVVLLDSNKNEWTVTARIDGTLQVE